MISSFDRMTGCLARWVACLTWVIGLRSTNSHRQAWLNSEHRIFLIFAFVPFASGQRRQPAFDLHSFDFS